jgi:Ca2+-binding RTX toxin-like protein
MQQYDPAGNPIGAAYVHSIQGLPGLGHVEIAAMPNGGYAVSFIDESNFGAVSYVDLFAADGTHLASDPVAQAGFQLITSQAVAGLADGGFAVSWVAAEYNTSDMSNPAPYAVFGAEYAADGSVAVAAQMLGVLPQNNNTPPQIDAYANGGYTISWLAGGTPQSQNFIEQGTALTPDSNDSLVTPAVAFTLPNGPRDVTLVGAYAQTVTGNNLGDTITANDYASTLIGGSGNDTLIAGHGADIMSGDGGADVFRFPYLPWNAGSITDFNTATDKLDLSGIFNSIGYTGSNPVGDGYLNFVADGSGDTLVYVDPQGPSTTTPVLVTTIDHVAPSSITPADYGYSGSSSGGGGDTTGETLTANDTAGQQLTGTPGNDIFYAEQNSVIMTGDGGADVFVFNGLPWNAGSITDFTPGNDKLDLSALLSANGFTRSDPVADGWVTFSSDGQGDTQVFFNAHSSSDPWPTLITTLDNVSPTGLTAANTLGTAGSSSSGGGGSATVDESQPSYAVPNGVTTVVLTGSASQSVTANNQGDTITSNDYGSTITGGAGNDTLIAGHGADMLTGNGGDDSFVYNDLPWNAGAVADFNTASDVLNLKGIFAGIGYTGSNPVADGYLTFASDGHGDTQVIVSPQGPSTPIPILVTTLDHVDPSAIHSGDYLFA